MECLLGPVAVSSSCSLQETSRHLIQARKGLKGKLRTSAFITRRNCSGSVSTSYRRLRPCCAARDEEKMTTESDDKEPKKDVNIHIRLEDGTTTTISFKTYTRTAEARLGGIGVRASGSSKVLAFEDIRSGGTYELVPNPSELVPNPSDIKMTGRLRNLEGWRKSMSSAQEEEGAERLVDIASKHSNGQSVKRVDKKLFKDDNGLLLEEIDACVLAGEFVIIGKAKTSVRPRDVVEFLATLEDIKHYADNGVGDFKMMEGKRVVGCLIIKSLPENMAERKRVLELASTNGIMIEVPNGLAWSSGNLLFSGGNWASGLKGA